MENYDPIQRIVTFKTTEIGLKDKKKDNISLNKIFETVFQVYSVLPYENTTNFQFNTGKSDHMLKSI